jgi:stalled ribosome rescue protein Dom34
MHSRAVIRIDHWDSQLLTLEAESWTSHTIRPQANHTTLRGGVRTNREYFSDVCDALTNTHEVLVAGHHAVQRDFRQYIRSHRPSLEQRIVGWETVDEPTEGQLVALARTVFDKRDNIAGMSRRG